MQGFSLRWFWTDPTLSVRNDPTLAAALEHSLVLAGLAMLIATPLGTALAIGLQRWRGRGSGVTNIVMLLPLVLTGCLSIQLVSDYDPEIDAGLSRMNTETTAFVDRMIAARNTPEGTYAANKDFYIDQIAAVDTLVLRAEAHQRLPEPDPQRGERAQRGVVRGQPLEVAQHAFGQPKRAHAHDRHHQGEHRRLQRGRRDEPCGGGGESHRATQCPAARQDRERQSGQVRADSREQWT